MNQRVQNSMFMKQALALAQKVQGNTTPNPLVGAVIADAQGKIIATGFHKKAGMPHAEIEALKKAGKKAKGATLYVNLEPCSHWGRTPPCTDAIIEAGIRRVVIALKDPNPRMNGKSIALLKKKGIAVICGVLEQEARRLNEVFFKNMTAKMPFVTAKVAQTLDGKIAAGSGDSCWITSNTARQYARHLRGMHDAVMVGINTVLHDNPFLDIPVKKDNFVKIIIDPFLKVPAASNLFKNTSCGIIIICSKEAVKRSKEKADVLQRKKNVRFLIQEGRDFSLRAILEELYRKFSVCSVFVEGGSSTLGRCFDEKVVGKIYFFIAPKILGGTNALASVGGKGIPAVRDAIMVRKLEIKRIGNDFLLSGYPAYKKNVP